MEFILLEVNSPSWNYIWDFVENHPINDGIELPKSALNNGYQWEYMGSYKQGNNVISKIIHKSHPKTQELYTINISHEITQEQITKSIKI